ncbi:alpha/beta hydrolase [Agrobacterium larrymoorei]|uniref:alpha/beta hydrolase n=1 Tax=Rhizobium/Agrobacterium group TaxID=227290 RepID=UPI001441FBD7|nr:MULTISPECIES: alpha/beta hydrolase [Rhizobium/Agrobacterium group]NKM57730.1 alpha/beta hydrolase fold domain-containing protein [Rhizobium anhuiense]NTJ44966.1 alpha/beta hydrolase [Agrobacterium larrymoorei]
MLDEDSAALVRGLRSLNIPRTETLTPLQARAAMAAARRARAPLPVPMDEVRDLDLGKEKNHIAGRLYRPNAQRDLPLLVFFHGGGWVLGDLESHDLLCRRLALAGKTNVLAVDYRLAPENKFPSAIEDAIEAVDWAFAHAGELQVNVARIMVGGDSAGGNLAAVVAHERRNNNKPRLACQILIYPATDLACASPSYQIAEDGLPVLGSTMIWFRDHYLTEPFEKEEWRASPLRAPDFSDLPPAYVLTAGYDPLSDEGQAYADKLLNSDVSVVHHHYPGQIHGFLSMGPELPTTETAIAELGAYMRGRSD